ncbi:hypothetical protein BJV78DRAFT_1217003 [Lactifluus subvellereus]|nr:hypothetical protein BJV78DRAFT_1217003 [Lactifluus subvellereus]
MTFACIGCGRSFGHKTGLSNHRRVCTRWKNFDAITIQKMKRRREYQQRTLDVNSQQHLGDPSRPTEPPGPAQQGPSFPHTTNR